jgi:hypothetical protein
MKNRDTIASITVLDINNIPVGGAEVRIYSVDSQGIPTGRINYTTTTDASGKAIFNFNDLYKKGQAGFAVLNIEAEKNNLAGNGIIKVEEEKTNEATVTIQ